MLKLRTFLSNLLAEIEILNNPIQKKRIKLVGYKKSKTPAVTVGRG